jgi:hypothetical protein
MRLPDQCSESNMGTDRYIVDQWQPSLLARIRDSLNEYRKIRRCRRIERGPCKVCGKVKPAAAWGEDDYWCSECLNGLFA